LLLRRQRSGESWFNASPGKELAKSYLEKSPSQKRAGGICGELKKLTSQRINNTFNVINGQML
jgi:hypothetical protein